MAITHLNHWLRYWIGAPIRKKLRAQLKRTWELTADCREVQRKTLQRILFLNAGSDLCRDHDLSGNLTEGSFARRMPISNYETFSPYIERLRNGENTALLGPKNFLEMFALTSGTTASTKHIPITTHFVNDYRRGWQTWGIAAFDDHPKLHNLRILQLCSDYDKYRTPSGIPCGNISGLVQQTQNPIVRSRYTVPAAAQKIDDPSLKYYYSLLCSLAAEDVGLISTANPSTVLQLIKVLSQHGQQLIRDLYDGRVRCPSSEVDATLACRKLRTRASQLDRILERSGSLQPTEVWPHLQLLAVWTGGSVAGYLPELRLHFPGISIRDHGLSASEGRMTIPFSDESSSGLLDIESHFFEFIPEEEWDSDQPDTLLADELEVGKLYHILLTTVSGLYRYNIHDVVECTGFRGTTPELKFLHKGAHISSVTGEKLTESQVVAAAQDVCPGVMPQFIVSPHWDNPPGYIVWVEAADQDFPFNRFDLALQSQNIEYQEKRTTGRLAPIKRQLVPAGTFQNLAQKRQSGVGGSEEQYKHPWLVPELDFSPVS